MHGPNATSPPHMATRLAAAAAGIGKRARSRGLSLGAALRTSPSTGELGGGGGATAGGGLPTRRPSHRPRPAGVVALVVGVAAVVGGLALLGWVAAVAGGWVGKGHPPRSTTATAAAAASAGTAGGHRRGGAGAKAAPDVQVPVGVPGAPPPPPLAADQLPRLPLPPPRCGNVFVHLHDGDGTAGAAFFRTYGANDSHVDPLVRLGQPRRIDACVHVFEGGARHDGALGALAAAPTPRWTTPGGRARRLYVYPRAVLAATDGVWQGGGGGSPPLGVRTVAADHFLLAATYPRGTADAADGVVAVRLAVTAAADAAAAVAVGGEEHSAVATLQLLYGAGGGGGGPSRSVLCQRVDYVMVNVAVGVSTDTMSALAVLATAINADHACRTHVVLKPDGATASRSTGAPVAGGGASADSGGAREALPPPPPQNLSRSVFYAVLAGPPTFRSRVAGATATWAAGAPPDRITFYTAAAFDPADRAVARGLPVVVAAPTPPDRPGVPDEQWPERMQSWSHLVRLRLAWDGALRDDPSIRWLALVDDDTFVYTDAAATALAAWNDKLPLWGGSGEIVRVDNGDAGPLASRLRATHLAAGGTPCAMPGEPAYARTHPHGSLWGGSSKGGRDAPPRRCSDTFCKGCAPIPQGGTIFLSRALVAAIRPSIEACEAATRHLCGRCGSQRLYACVTGAVPGARSAMLRGVHRSPWRREPKQRALPVLSFHGFEHARGRYTATGSLEGDFARLWALRRPGGEGVTMGDVADDVNCRRGGHWLGGHCVK